MKVLGFVVIVLGIIIAYIGITGSQHRVMAIISKKPLVKSGQPINTGSVGSSKGTLSSKRTGGGQGPLPQLA